MSIFLAFVGSTRDLPPFISKTDYKRLPAGTLFCVALWTGTTFRGKVLSPSTRLPNSVPADSGAIGEVVSVASQTMVIPDITS